MLHFTLELLASFNTVDYSLLLTTLSMTSLSSVFSLSPLAISKVSSSLPDCCVSDFCMILSVFPRTHSGTFALSSHSHPFLELSVASQAGNSLIHTSTANPHACIADNLGFNMSQSPQAPPPFHIQAPHPPVSHTSANGATFHSTSSVGNLDADLIPPSLSIPFLTSSPLSSPVLSIS